MKPVIVRRPRSRQDVDEAAAFLAAENRAVGFSFLEAVEHTFGHLAGMPHMGPARTFPGCPVMDLRFFPVKGFPNYLVFYRPLEYGIEILRVLHSARDVPSLF